MRLTNEVTTPFGVGHPTNTGGSTLTIFPLGPDRRAINDGVTLRPGEGLEWYRAPEGAVAIAVANPEVEPGRPDGQLTYDMPVY